MIYRKDWNERSPLRVFENSIHGGLGKGNIGVVTSRKGVGPGSISYHPMGMPHGPHPGAYEASIGVKRTDELALMIDTFKPLPVASKALSVEGFNEFNQPYIERLKQWGTHIDGLNPVARTNVAPDGNAVPEPSVYGFSYTVPSDESGKTFVVAGAG